MHQIQFRSHTVTRVLFLVLGVLVVLSLSVALFHLVLHWRVLAFTELVDLDYETNLPTFYNSALFFVGAVLFYLQGRTGEAQQRHGWFLLSFAFCFLGIDEGSQVHEKFIDFTRGLINNGEENGLGLQWLFFAWVVPYSAAVLGMGLVLFRWFLRLPLLLRKRLLISCAVYLSGAVVMEMMGGKVADDLFSRAAAGHPSVALQLNDLGLDLPHASFRYIACYTIEETLEMTGLILCIRAVLKAFETKQFRLAFAVEHDTELQNVQGR